ncbi:proteasome subunit beta type-7-B-like isoform X2 [Drosophila willistoni]|uniref:proteasome subunit beta type-7-B-like isoform X2 n=1 Tax=Drosophila willistoni TaxID=7260 RepID=UPI001F086F32|nr:proteasome subunit beta type-7-B-like isoform X2 [Drosophila willistoni]
MIVDLILVTACGTEHCCKMASSHRKHIQMARVWWDFCIKVASSLALTHEPLKDMLWDLRERTKFFVCMILSSGSGVAQDLQQMANVASSQLDLLTMNNNRHRPRVCGANRLMKQYLYRFRTMINAHFIIAGVDVSGAHLFCTHSDGSSETVPYTVLGSGTMPAISIIESRWEPAMGEFFARDLVCDAVAAGIVSDINSGATIKLCIIRTDFTRQLCSQEVYIKAVDKPRPIALVGLVGPPQMAYIEEVYKKVYPVTSLPSRMNLLQRRSSLDLSLQTAIFSESEEDQQDKQDPTEAEEDQQGHEDQQGSLDLEVSLLEAGADQEDNDDGAPPTKRAKF